MSMPQIDLLDEENINRTIATTLLHIKDYLAVLVTLKDEKAGSELEYLHNSGQVLMPPPILVNSSVDIKKNDPEGENTPEGM